MNEVKRNHNAWGFLGEMSVYIKIRDLNEFIQLGLDEVIYVRDDEENIWPVTKRSIKWEEIE